jgi:hypothetical protein
VPVEQVFDHPGGAHFLKIGTGQRLVYSLPLGVRHSPIRKGSLVYFETQIEIGNSDLIEEISYELNEWLVTADAIEALTVIIGEREDEIINQALEIEELESRVIDLEQRLEHLEAGADIREQVIDIINTLNFSLEVN